MAAGQALVSQFKATLRQLKYDDAISERDLATLASHPKASSLLEWLCTNVSSDNTVAEEELKRFEVLKERQQILEGASLREALSEINRSSPGQELTDDELRHSVASLSEQVLVVGGANERLRRQHTLLSEQGQLASKRLQRIPLLEDRVKEEGKNQILATKQLNKKFNMQLEELMQTTGDVVAAALADGKVSSPESEAGFLSSLDIDVLQSGEEEFMRRLTEHTKKQFQGVKDMTSDQQQCHLLDTRDPQEILLAGESPAAIAEACEELVRLRSIFVAGQLQLHKAEAALANVTAAAALVEKKLATATLQQANSPGVSTDQSHSVSMRKQLEEAQAGVERLKSEIKSLTESSLPVALSELAALQDTHVLSGNYQLKLARQRYFLGKQNQLIEHLLHQRARHEVLAMMLELEERQHRKSHLLLKSLHSELDACCHQVTDATSVGKNPCLKRPDPDRHAVDSHDSTMTRLSALLSSDERMAGQADSQLIVTYDHIQQQADRLSQLMSSQASQLSAGRDAHSSQLATLEEYVVACDQVVTSSGVQDGLPTLELQELRKGMTDLEDLLSMLQKSVKDCLRQWSDKGKILSADEVEQQGRKLFAWFFTDPLRVELCIQHLQQQLE